MGDIVRPAYEARGLAPEDVVATSAQGEGSIRAIRAVEQSVEEVGQGVRVLAEATRGAVEETVEGGKRSVEETTEAMKDVAEESGEREAERQESFLLGFTRRLGRALPRDAKGVASLFGLGNVAEELTLLRGAISPVTSALGKVLLPAVKGLGVAAAAAGTAWAGFQAGNWLYEAIFPEGGRWVERQWEILFSDLRNKGLRAWITEAGKEIARGLTGRAAEEIRRLETEIPETAKARAGVAVVERLLGELAPAMRGPAAPGAAGRVRGMLGAPEVALLAGQTEAIQREVLGELLMRYGREVPEQLTSKIVEDMGIRRAVRETGGFLRKIERLPELGVEIEQIMATVGQRARRGAAAIGAGDLEKAMVESSRTRTGESEQLLAAVQNLGVLIQKGNELTQQDRRIRQQPLVPPVAVPMEVGRRMEESD